MSNAPTNPLSIPAADPKPTAQTPANTPAPQPDAGAPAGNTPAGIPPTPQPNAVEALAAKLQADYEKNGGKLSDSALAEAEASGFPKHYVMRFVEGNAAIKEREAKAVADAAYEAAGGKEKFESMRDWAKNNLAEEQKKLFEEAVASGDPTKVKTIAQAIYSEYTSKVGTDPQRFGGSSANTGPAPFRDRSELVAAMRDPRYESSNAYRKEVEARILVSGQL